MARAVQFLIIDSSFLILVVLVDTLFVVEMRGHDLPPYVFETNRPKSINLSCDYERQMQQYLTALANKSTSCELDRIRRVRCPKTMVRDGNGLFRAISYLLYRDERRFNDVRQEIVHHVVQNWSEYEPWIVGSDIYSIDVDSVDYYEWYMGSNGTWGSEVELNAATRVYRIRLRVYTDPTYFHEMGDEQAMTYALLYTGNGYNGYYRVVEDVFKSCPPQKRQVGQRNARLSRQALKEELKERRRQKRISEQRAKNALSRPPLTEISAKVDSELVQKPTVDSPPPEKVTQMTSEKVSALTSVREPQRELADDSRPSYQSTNAIRPENRVNVVKKPSMDKIFSESPIKRSGPQSFPVLAY